ncbi:hypothetical protein ASPZODRAFT_895238 [Penicilliopsis zonata CBS 506.65]|uniref:Zn(2)-C6 fungal-type domain-containing protein n=1 Tax=Penicilliopsis zonata CBS 506.65 TaxID=1073090 RepID=A0A1L9S8R2_9EURO|nr:hypothetical protein ASPZODRAFT_895238 [Penicilliopsis zonata CBS 506.65]OJJ43543.1 hypothetical protein ASPZODRAFT_895238 [Penicilliopsis zonata CBS 506.65]
MDHRPPKRLRAAASTACSQCRTAKKRCEGGIPCISCKRRELPCTLSMSTSSPNEALNEESPGNEAEIKRKYSLDVHPSLYEDTSKLIDRYFDVVAPLWQVVVPSDLNHQPFASPLLVRAICLLSALSLPVVNSIFITQVTESIHQCFDAEDLLSLPSISTLQALLLLLACPGFSQRSIMVSSALRMASILGFNRAQSPRPILYWSCVAWARWDAIMLRGSSGINDTHILQGCTGTVRKTGYIYSMCFFLALQQDGNHSCPSACKKGTMFGSDLCRSTRSRNNFKDYQQTIYDAVHKLLY